MFGPRQDYKNYFQLWIPESLLSNWSKCFAFHKLALEAWHSDAGSPVWLADYKTTPTSPASIDRSSVDFEGGEMSFSIFDYDARIVEDNFNRNNRSDKEILVSLRNIFDNNQFPDYVYNYLMQELRPNSNGLISFHKPSGFGTAASKYTTDEIQSIRRTKGIFATNEYRRSEAPMARHHLKVFHNGSGKARLFYKINSNAIKFIQNRR